MDRLPKAFVKNCSSKYPTNLGPLLRYNRRVIEIEETDKPDKRDEGVYIFYENPRTGYNNDHEYKNPQKWFDIVVIAIPFSSLRRVRMLQTNASPDKLRAIRQLHYQNSCKVILEFGYKFWLHDDKIIGGKSITDLPIRQIVYPGHEQMKREEHRAVLLASYTLGTDSLRWTSLPAGDRIRFALRDVATVHGIDEKRMDEFRKLCIGGMSHSWVDDEFTAGAFAMFAPSQLVGLFDHVWKPEGRIHYCGEHTSVKHGWIEGAVESGIRAAREVCERISPDGKVDPCRTSAQQSKFVFRNWLSNFRAPAIAHRCEH